MSDIQNDFLNSLGGASSVSDGDISQAPMGAVVRLETDVDMVFCIDVTGSMGPFLDSVKSMVQNLYDDLVRELAGRSRLSRNFRAKIIAFRDYYADGEEYAMNESRFYNLTDPDDNLEFCEYVAGLKQGGGGDEPENALEALALAMKKVVKYTPEMKEQDISSLCVLMLRLIHWNPISLKNWEKKNRTTILKICWNLLLR